MFYILQAYLVQRRKPSHNAGIHRTSLDMVASQLSEVAQERSNMESKVMGLER